MPVLKKLSISSKILLVLTLFAGLCTALVAAGTYHVGNLAEITQNVVSHAQGNLRLAYLGQQHMIRLHQLAFQLNDSEEPDEIFATLQSERERMQVDLEALRKIVNPADLEALTRIVEAADAYDAIVQRNRTFLRQDKGEDAEDLLLSDGVKIFGSVDTAFAEMIGRLSQELTSSADTAGREANDTIWLMISVSIVGLLGGFGFALVFFRREITAPLRTVSDAMNKLANGDLDSTLVAHKRGDEIGDLSRAFGMFRQAAIDKSLAETEAADGRRRVDEERKRNFEAQAEVTKNQNAVVGSLAEGLSQLASGNLTCQLTGTIPEGYRKLADDFNTAIDRLQEAM
jgi:methyl-accepting chemotaxis protein